MSGGSFHVTIPPQFLKILELKDGDEITKGVFRGKYGLFIALWNPEQQAKYQAKEINQNPPKPE